MSVADLFPSQPEIPVPVLPAMPGSSSWSYNPHRPFGSTALFLFVPYEASVLSLPPRIAVSFSE